MMKLAVLVVPVLMEAMVIAHGVSRSILAKVAHNAKVPGVAPTRVACNIL